MTHNSENPFAAPKSGVSADRSRDIDVRRKYQMDPIVLLDNHLSVVANMSITTFLMACVMALGIVARDNGYRSLYHLSFMATVPIAWSVLMIPVNIWGCARHCGSLPGKFCGILSLLLIPGFAVHAVATNASGRVAFEVSSILLLISIAAFSGLMTSIANQLKLQRTQVVAVALSAAAILAALWMTRIKNNTDQLFALRLSLAILVISNLFLVIVIRSRCRRAKIARQTPVPTKL